MASKVADERAHVAAATLVLLHEAGVNYEGHRYLAHHAFANETAVGPRRIAITQYDRAWATMAWDRTMCFFGRHLA